MTDFERHWGSLPVAMPFIKHLGIDIVEITDGSSVARLEQRPVLSTRRHIPCWRSVHAW